MLARVLFIRLGGLILILTNTASVTTGRLIPRGGNSTFFIAMVEPSSVYTKAGGGFVLQSTLLNFNYWCGRAALLLRKAHQESTPPHLLTFGGLLCFWEAVCDLKVVGEIMADVGLFAPKMTPR